MNSDPWLTEDGKPHPAAEWMGMPEVDGEVLRYRADVDGDKMNEWWLLLPGEAQKGRSWCGHTVSPTIAAALLEKHLREKLAAEQNLDVRPMIFYDDEGENPHTAFAVFNFMTETYLTERGDWDHEFHYSGVQEFQTYTAALQAACMAAKGESDEQDAE